MIVLLVAQLALAGALDDGLSAFEQGDLPGAIEAWESVEGRASAAVHFNAGVARYRQGDFPRAVAHWRAARQQRPRDADVLHNLALARSRLKGAGGTPVGEPLGWMALLTPGELGLASLGLLLAAGAGGWLHRLGRIGGSWRIWAAVGALAIVLSGLTLEGVWAVENRPVAVVVDAPAVLRDAASVHAKETGELAPGSEVSVRRTVGDFVQVRTGDGAGGWIPRDSAVLVGLR